MATVVLDLSFDNERMSFSGTPEDDMAFAKTFWQSVQLLPPMESRLVSSDIKQRLKVAPPGNQSVHVTYPNAGEPTKLQEFLTKAKQKEKADEMRKCHALSVKKQESRQLLEKHRQSRIQKESISSAQKPRETTDKFALPITDYLIENVDEEPQKVLDDLDAFESRHLKEDPDSD